MTDMRRQCDRGSMTSALERILRAQLDGHQRLLSCIQRKRQAIRTADLAQIDPLCAEERAMLTQTAELERQRVYILEGFAASNLKSQDPPAFVTISDIAAATPEPQRTVLVALAAQLREAVAQVKRESSVVRAAAEALSRHMGGIVQTVHSALSRARVYGARGSIALGIPLQSTVDLKS